MPTKELIRLAYSLLRNPEVVRRSIEIDLRNHFSKQTKMHYTDEFVYSRLALCEVTDLLLKNFGSLTSQTMIDNLFAYRSVEKEKL